LLSEHAARSTATLDEVVTTMENHQIRRLPVVDGRGGLVGIIAQADIASKATTRQAANLVREVSKETGR